jgi:DNA-binding transcriptional ArsR family regulator
VTGDTDLAAVGALLAEPASASHHLARLADAGLITAATRGRHRYFTLAGPQVADLLEAAARVAPQQPVTSLRQGTRAHAIRYARRCYDHLAGRLGVAVADALQERGVVVLNGGAGFVVTEVGVDALAELGVAAHAGDVARCCVDWSEQRAHVAGALGRDLMARVLELRWLTRNTRTRALSLTDSGRVELPLRLGVRVP